MPTGYDSVIGPSWLVHPQEDSLPTEAFQRIGFYTKGYFWEAFVQQENGTDKDLYYKTSTDGINWTTRAKIADDVYQEDFSLWFDGTHVHIVYSQQVVGCTVRYRRGYPESDGTLTMDSEDVVDPGEATWTMYFPSICTDYAGVLYVTYLKRKRDGSSSYYWGYLYLNKSSTNDGTWTTASGFPKQLRYVYQGAYGAVMPSMVLPWSTGVCVVYINWILYARTWNGIVLGDEETLWDAEKQQGMPNNWEMWSATSWNDNIIVAWMEEQYWPTQTNNLLFWLRRRDAQTGIWSDFVIVWDPENEGEPDAPGDYWTPVLVMNGGLLYCYWTVDVDWWWYYKWSIGGCALLKFSDDLGDTWSERQILFQTTSVLEQLLPMFVSSWQSAFENKIGFRWWQNTYQYYYGLSWIGINAWAYSPSIVHCFDDVIISEIRAATSVERDISANHAIAAGSNYTCPANEWSKIRELVVPNEEHEELHLWARIIRDQTGTSIEGFAKIKIANSYNDELSESFPSALGIQTSVTALPGVRPIERILFTIPRECIGETLELWIKPNETGDYKAAMQIYGHTFHTHHVR